MGIDPSLLRIVIFLRQVSEGVDFSDINGRAVVIIGLPFPPTFNPKVNNTLLMNWSEKTLLHYFIYTG